MFPDFDQYEVRYNSCVIPICRMGSHENESEQGPPIPTPEKLREEFLRPSELGARD